MTYRKLCLWRNGKWEFFMVTLDITIQELRARYAVPRHTCIALEKIKQP